MNLQCPKCGRKKEVERNIVMAICYRCQEWMIEIKEVKKDDN